jgi:hypothetical protein
LLKLDLALWLDTNNALDVADKDRKAAPHCI